MTPAVGRDVGKRSGGPISAPVGIALSLVASVVLASATYAWTSAAAPHRDAARATGGDAPLADASAVQAARYVVAGALPGLAYAHVPLAIDGLALTYAASDCAPADGEWVACRGSTPRAASDEVAVGDAVHVAWAAGFDGATLHLIGGARDAVVLVAAAE